MTEPVVLHRGHGLPYSKGLTSQALSASGVAPHRAFELAREIEDRLVERACRDRPRRASHAAEEVLRDARGRGPCAGTATGTASTASTAR